MPGANDLVATHCTRLAPLTGQDYTATGKPRIAWDDEAAREELVTALVGDALALLGRTRPSRRSPRQGGKPAEAVALLALVAGQDVEPAEGSDGTDGRWRIARKTAPDRVISTVDPDARHAHKTRERRQDGFKAHVVVEPDTGLTTAVKLTKTNGPENSDAAVGADLVTTDPTIAAMDRPRGPGRLRLRHRRHARHPGRAGSGLPVLKPWPLRPAVPGGFTLDDFTHDRRTAGTLTCPAGVTRPVTKAGNAVSFGSPARLPAAQRCTTAKAAARSMVHEHHLLQREHRTPSRRTKTSRPPTAGTGRWSNAPSPGSPEALAASPTAASRRTTTGSTTASPALNLRRLLALGLTHQDGAWVLT